MPLISQAHSELQLRAHADIDAHAGQQIDVIDLVLDNIAVVDNRTPLLVDLRTNDIPLVIHLVAAVAGVVLAVPQVETLVAAISLVSSYEIRGIAAATAAALAEKLIILLHANCFALPADLVARVAGVILVETAIHAGVSCISLVTPHKGRLISTVADSVIALIILLVASWSGQGDSKGR